MLNEIRAAAGLVGTARFKMVAAASTAQDPATDEHMLQSIMDLVERVSGPFEQTLTATTTFKDLQLTDPQIGAILLEIEQVFR
ncbi:hypothetical protein ACXYUI_29020, partial [Klebsiella pneumoniae]